MTIIILHHQPHRRHPHKLLVNNTIITMIIVCAITASTITNTITIALTIANANNIIINRNC